MSDSFHSKKRIRSLHKLQNTSIDNEIKQYICLRKEFHLKKSTLNEVYLISKQWLNLWKEEVDYHERKTLLNKSKLRYSLSKQNTYASSGSILPISNNDFIVTDIKKDNILTLDNELPLLQLDFAKKAKETSFEIWNFFYMKYKGGPEIKIPYKYNVKNQIYQKEFLIKLIKIQFVLICEGDYNLNIIKERVSNNNVRNKSNNDETTTTNNKNNSDDVKIFNCYFNIYQNFKELETKLKKLIKQHILTNIDNDLPIECWNVISTNRIFNIKEHLQIIQNDFTSENNNYKSNNNNDCKQLDSKGYSIINLKQLFHLENVRSTNLDNFMIIVDIPIKNKNYEHHINESEYNYTFINKNITPNLQIGKCENCIKKTILFTKCSECNITSYCTEECKQTDLSCHENKCISHLLKTVLEPKYKYRKHHVKV